MSPLTQAVEDYIQLRRGLGFKLKDYGDYLHKFVAFLQAQGSSHITTRLALDFATLPNHQKAVSWARQLGILRKFAIYRRNADPRTEVPPLGILPFRSKGAVPYLYSEDEIVRLMDAAGAIESRYNLQPLTYRCLFGLLAVSGMRLGEALGLPRDGIDWGQSLLTIRGAKFGKSRLVQYTIFRVPEYSESSCRRGSVLGFVGVDLGILKQRQETPATCRRHLIWRT